MPPFCICIMENSPELGARLAEVFKLVRRGAAVIDVGSDHGYLPASLILRGVCGSCIVTDVNAAPLERARRTFAEYNVDTWRVDFRLADGLCGVELPLGNADICICGMGGELIASILEKRRFARGREVHLILQPMTREWALRRFLWDNGFETEAECAAEEKGKVYCVMSVYFTGRSVEYADGELFCGKRSARRASAAFTKYLDKTARSLEKKSDGIKKGGGDAAYFDKIIEWARRELSFETNRSEP